MDGGVLFLLPNQIELDHEAIFPKHPLTRFVFAQTQNHLELGLCVKWIPAGKEDLFMSNMLTDNQWSLDAENNGSFLRIICFACIAEEGKP